MESYELIITKSSQVISYQQQDILELRILLSTMQSYSNKKSVIPKASILEREFENIVKLKLKTLFYKTTM